MAGVTLAPKHFALFVRPSASQIVFASVLLVGFLVRSIAAFSVNVSHPYEMFQELEQGHRLAFGSGVVPFEFLYGYRSWLIPALIGAFMKASSWVSSNPLVYLYGLRLTAVLVSLSAVASAYIIVGQIHGRAWAALGGLVSAIWFQTIYFAPFLMPEVFAAYLALGAIALVATPSSQHGTRHSAFIGALLGLAFCLRFQMAPALAIVAWWHCRRALRERWTPLVVAAAAMVLLVAGGLDFATWGTPFQSIWMNFHMNVDKDVAQEFGTASQFYYFACLSASPHSLFVAVFLGWLAIVGAFRAPLLALTALAIAIPHSFIAHKEYRFICFALMTMPMLMAIGLATIGRYAQAKTGPWGMRGATSIVLVLMANVSLYEFQAIAKYRYSRNEGVLRSFLAARKIDRLCGLGVSGFIWHNTGGYTYLHRDVPIYFAGSLTTTNVPGYYGTYDHPTPALATRFDFRGQPSRQYLASDLLKHPQAYNVLVSRENDRAPPGFSRVQCFTNGPAPLKAACVYERPGDCH